MEAAKTFIEVTGETIKSLPASVQAVFSTLMGIIAYIDLTWVTTLGSFIAVCLVIRVKLLEIKLRKMEIKSKECDS